MAKLLKDLGLASKTLVSLAALSDLVVDDLNGRGLPGRFARGFVYHAHRAGAQDAFDPK